MTKPRDFSDKMVAKTVLRPIGTGRECRIAEFKETGMYVRMYKRLGSTDTPASWALDKPCKSNEQEDVLSVREHYHFEREPIIGNPDYTLVVLGDRRQVSAQAAAD